MSRLIHESKYKCDDSPLERTSQDKNQNNRREELKLS